MSLPQEDRTIQRPGTRNPAADPKFFNRDLSWLRFNHRVLQEAMDARNPLYERIRFLAIFSSNLDEFFRVRISEIRGIRTIQKEMDTRLIQRPKRLLRKIRQEVLAQQEAFGAVIRDSIIPELKQSGVDFVERHRFTPGDQALIAECLRGMQDSLTPFRISPGGSDVFLKNEQIYLLSELGGGEMLLVPLPQHPQRFISLPGAGDAFRFTTLDDILCEHLESSYGTPFYSVKISRDAGLHIGDEYSGNLLEKIKEALAKRDAGPITRALIDYRAPESLIEKFRAALGLKKADLLVGGKYHNLKDLFQIPNACRLEVFEPLPPLPQLAIDAHPGVFDAAVARDRLFYFPYESFDYIVRFLAEAASDPRVRKIKVTLYRISSDSKIARELLEATRNGKEVFAFIETKARFDEENNIRWGRILEEHGARVKYSYPDIKVHSKIMYVEREQDGGCASVSYIGTGNLNEKTAGIYTDFGLLTADEGLNQEVSRVFDMLEGRIITPRARKLLVSPFNARSGFQEWVEREIERARAGKTAYIILKMNSLEDPGMIRLLYRASNAGVQVRLLIRGICCLVPGVPDQSESIVVTSIVDRFLEHPRVYIFGNGGKESLFIGSADWMTRNLDHRIEVITPILDADIHRRIRRTIDLQLEDNVKARIIDARQQNQYVSPGGQARDSSQHRIYEFLNQETG